MKLFYYAATLTMKTLLLSFTRWRVEGKENVPQRGPLIVVANHINLIDPPLLFASIPRRIVFMAKEELFHSSPGSVFIRASGAFQVKRGERDREALRQALMVLEKGQVLGMFPEGKRSPNAQLRPAQAGTSLIATRSGAPILPVAISGSEKVTGIGSIFRRPSITVTIGRPFLLSPPPRGQSHSRLEELTALTMEHIAELLPRSYRGVYNSRVVEGAISGD